MVATSAYYAAIAYGIPFAAFAIIFLLITIVHKRINWFILHNILGIQWGNRSDDEKSKTKNDLGNRISSATKSPSAQTEHRDNEAQQLLNSYETTPMDMYLYIDIDETKMARIPPLPCIVRLLSDILASAVLAVFAAIIFDSLVMSNVIIGTGTKCPKFNADCFGKIGNLDSGPFNCSDGQYANFATNASSLWCAGWVYQNVGINDVLQALGTCGGLLGIISTIVPFVYYLSYYKKRYYLSLLCIILPLIPLVALGLSIGYTLPQEPSQLTIVVFFCLSLQWSLSAGVRHCGDHVGEGHFHQNLYQNFHQMVDVDISAAPYLGKDTSGIHGAASFTVMTNAALGITVNVQFLPPYICKLNLKNQCCK